MDSALETPPIVLPYLFVGSRKRCTDIDYQREKMPQHQCYDDCMEESQHLELKRAQVQHSKHTSLLQ